MQDFETANPVALVCANCGSVEGRSTTLQQFECSKCGHDNNPELAHPIATDPAVEALAAKLAAIDSATNLATLKAAIKDAEIAKVAADLQIDPATLADQLKA